jgi:hypothetical protein
MVPLGTIARFGTRCSVLMTAPQLVPPQQWSSPPYANG